MALSIVEVFISQSTSHLFDIIASVFFSFDVFVFKRMRCKGLLLLLVMVYGLLTCCRWCLVVPGGAWWCLNDGAKYMVYLFDK
jgi:hypothetical protein